MSKIWFELAIDNYPINLENTFFDAKYATTYPIAQLCVTEYWLGNVERSIELNETLGKLKPDSKTYLYNKKFFDGLKNKDK